MTGNSKVVSGRKVPGRKKGSPKVGGRVRGTPNRVTADVRQAIATIAQNNIDAFGSWLAAIEDPARRCEVFLKALEYHLPRLSRSDVTATVRPAPANAEPIRDASQAAEVYRSMMADPSYDLDPARFDVAQAAADSPTEPAAPAALAAPAPADTSPLPQLVQPQIVEAVAVVDPRIEPIDNREAIAQRLAKLGAL